MRNSAADLGSSHRSVCVQPLSTALIEDGGMGDDSLLVNLAGGSISNRLAMAIHGGNGDDTVIGKLAPVVLTGGVFTALFDGGDGQDTVIGFLIPCTTFPDGEGLYAVSFMGGRGDDVIDVMVDLSRFSGESGRLGVAVDAGQGSDHVTFLVQGADGPMANALFTLDGGRGEDFAIVSALVDVKNVEHVVIV